MPSSERRRPKKTKPEGSLAQSKARPKKARTKASRLTRRFEYAEGQHPVHVYLSGLGEDSARVMSSALESIADILSDGRIPAENLAWHTLQPEHVNGLRGRLQRLYAPATANRYLTALRSVLKEAWRLELIERKDMDRALDVPAVKGSRELRGRAVGKAEIAGIFAACAQDENRAAGARDAAILALLYGSGVRRAEAAVLTVEDFDKAEGALQIQGKGNKTRTVYLPKGTQKALTAWLDVRGMTAGPFFCHVSKSGVIRLKAVTAQLIYRVVLKRHLAAGMKYFTPHDLRRSCISELLDGGVDLSTIARQVGHSNVQTTARYDRRGSRAQQQAVRRLDVPF